ncbi:HTH_XRE domain containing protein [uncultured Caudovirales phage]|uniref:HTH_XRE domain containing protein n=1 Tax=uncultured Caudovirales phage TaxID=2100421 RepID=A0A6J5MVM2_9CAUD|nr:HTH_XRE domain containing protein [uncultured Caudovirales phage]
MNSTKNDFQRSMLLAGRVKSDLTQAHVAKKLGYTSPQFISNIERGITAIPFPLLLKLGRLYKIDRDDLIEARVDDYRAGLKKKAKS